MPDAAHPVLLQSSPWRLPQIENAIERGLGVSSAAAVTLKFEGVNDAAAIEAILREPPQTG